MNDSTGDYSISIKGPGLSFQRECSFEEASRAIAALAGGAAKPAAVDVQKESRAASVEPVSIRERLDELGGKTKVEQILVISEWLISQNGMKSVTKDDIKSSFVDAAEPLPSNFPRDFANVLKRGWLATVHGDRNSFYVTQTGRKALTTKFE
ncbi:MAG TPA: hypothetical protein VGN68_06445 [Sphingopyxis sp.]|jgi:hypothetical protein|uniref:hypothetical protein n=1 Tax=Sphingopyxis sp. TaxID=1908224 RepID=UPI002E0F0DCD|nr:hypothetical protein [Sphingopyxis sp.]